MAVFGITKSKILNPNVKLLLFPIILIGSLGVLFVVLVQNGYHKITTELDQLENSRKTESLLIQKLNSLRSIDQSVLDKADATLLALPERNPANFLLAQVNKLGEEKGVSYSKIRSTSRVKAAKEIQNAKISLSANTSDIKIVVDYLKALRMVLPIASIEKAEIDRKDEIVTTSIELNIFWSDLPTTLPPITEPIRALRSDEQELLTEISSYERPEFLILEASQPVDRDNPFN